MKITKCMEALSLALVLTVGSASPAFAAEPTIDKYAGITFTHEDVFSHNIVCPKGTELPFGNSTPVLHDGLIRIFDGKNYGFMDKSGNVVIPCKFSGCSDFSEGLAMVYYGTYVKIAASPGLEFYSQPTGYINTKGELVIPYEHEVYNEGGSGAFFEGLVCVGVDVDDDADTFIDYASYIDKNGKEVICGKKTASRPLIMSGMPFHEGYCVVNYNTVLDESGDVVLSIPDGNIMSVSEGLIACYKTSAGKYGFVDLSGKLVVPFKYDGAEDFSEGRACVRVKQTDGSFKYGYVDTAGNEIIPCVYDDGKSFSGGLVAVSKKDGNGKSKYGYINGEGKQIIDFLYDEAGAFQDGLACVKKDGKYGYISSTGWVVIPFVYDYVYQNYDTQNIYSPSDLGTFVDGVAAVSINGVNMFIKHPDSVEHKKTSALTATPTTSTVLVNGKEIAFDAYTINGNNYFKLRDVAQVVSGSGKQFQVTWDETKNAINLVSGQAYTVVGGELAKGDGKTKTASASTSAIYKDGVTFNLTAYTKGGNNYFKLRDLGQAFNFNVSWDVVNNAVIIDTTASYTAD